MYISWNLHTTLFQFYASVYPVVFPEKLNTSSKTKGIQTYVVPDSDEFQLVPNEIHLIRPAMGGRTAVIIAKMYWSMQKRRYRYSWYFNNRVIRWNEAWSFRSFALLLKKFVGNNRVPSLSFVFLSIFDLSAEQSRNDYTWTIVYISGQGAIKLGAPRICHLSFRADADWNSKSIYRPIELMKFLSSRELCNASKFTVRSCRGMMD